jgi:hypothetical protein
MVEGTRAAPVLKVSLPGMTASIVSDAVKALPEFAVLPAGIVKLDTVTTPRR